MTRVACVGECMIELREPPGAAAGTVTRGFGGDTLNTATYLARLGTRTSYLTALGDDGWSEEMIAHWRAEGIDTDLVVRLPGRLPGLYLIRTDGCGERRFSYWRNESAARSLFAIPETPRIAASLADFDLIHISGITLSLYGETGRRRLFNALEGARARGGRVSFDTNFRPRGWPHRGEAEDAFERAMELADVTLASVEDLEGLFGPAAVDRFMVERPGSERVLKLATPACRVRGVDGATATVEAEPVPREEVVDTTAAGDSFAAAYLAARLEGLSPVDAARRGHRLAGAVVRRPGAIIPRSAMPTLSN